jgi:predicted nucleotidyltransferase
MIPLIEDNLAEIAALCERFGVRSLDLFGSASTGAFDVESSDVDFVVDFGEYAPGHLDRYFGLEDGLKQLLGREVDLVTEKSIQNPIFRRSVDRSRKPIYRGRTDRKEVA